MEHKINLLSHLVKKVVIRKFEDIECESKTDAMFRESLRNIKKWNVSL